MQKEINVFESFDGVTGGDIILMIETIGRVSGRPNAIHFGSLSSRVNGNLAVFI